MRAFRLTNSKKPKTIPSNKYWREHLLRASRWLFKATKVALLVYWFLSVYLMGQMPGKADTGLYRGKTQAEVLGGQLASARDMVRKHPADSQAHYQLAEILRRSGRNREASQEYMLAIARQKDLYVAYHQLAQVCDDSG